MVAKHRREDAGCGAGGAAIEWVVVGVVGGAAAAAEVWVAFPAGVDTRAREASAPAPPAPAPCAIVTGTDISSGSECRY